MPDVLKDLEEAEAEAHGKMGGEGMREKSP